MKILELVLHLSKRLAFNGIRTIKYNPEHPQQVILGTNGSGKSSLMSELSPLPANGSDFEEGGYKRITVEHRGKVYMLLNDFTKRRAGHHSFMVDGEELNSGGTGQVQKTLVKEHFDLDQELYDLLTGVTNFREMSPTARRNWLVRMANDNMEYVIGLYNDTKSKLKETQGVIKYLTASIAEKNKELHGVDVNEQRLQLDSRLTNLKALHRELTKLSGKIDNNVKPLWFYEQELPNKLKQLTDLSDKVWELTIPDNIPKDINGIDKLCVQLTTQIEELNKQKQKELEKYQQVQEKIYLLTKAGADSALPLEKMISDLTSSIETNTKQLVSYPLLNTKTLGYAIKATDDVRAMFYELVNRLPDNTSGEFNRATMESYEDTKSNLMTKKDRLSGEIIRLKHKRDHIAAIDTVVCPSCSYHFKPGISKDELVIINDSINKTTDLLLELDKTLVECNTYLQRASEYRQTYRELVQLMNSTGVLTPLWDKVREHKLTNYHPNIYLTLFQQWENDLATMHYIHGDKASLEEAQAALKVLGNDETFKKEVHIEQLAEIDSHISVIDQTIKRCTKEHDELVKLKQHMAKVAEYKETLLNLEGEVDRLSRSYEEASWKQLISDELDRVTVSIGKVANELNKLDTTVEFLNDLNKRLNDATQRVEHLEVLIEELSPTNGLIAEYSIKFIEQFTSQMNEIINAIWTYDMQILPTPIDNDLTYKFPLYMADNDTETPDINKASTAQKGVIDFAFKLLLVRYLQLEDYPLYIDELTPNLDETHRINIMSYLRDYVESGKCSQLFMISHYVSNQKTFAGADFVVINKNNLLAIPERFNNNVELVYE